MEDQYVVSY